MDDYDKRFLKKVFKIFCILCGGVLGITLLGWGLTALFGETVGVGAVFVIIAIALISFMIALMSESI